MFQRRPTLGELPALHRRAHMAALGNLGFAYYNQGAYQRSMELTRQSTVLAHQLEDWVNYAYAALGFGLVMIQTGDAARAVELVGAAVTWAEAIDIKMMLMPNMEQVLERARAGLGDEPFAAVLGTGRLTPIEEVVAQLQLGKF